MILAGYGYVAVEREGDWSRGFETSAFAPSDTDGERWWMQPLGDRPWSTVGLGDVGGSGSQVRIVGYLSPTGRYGHLGSYAHEVLVTSGVEVPSAHH